MEKYAGTQSLARTFGLIRLFTDDRPIWTLPEIIEASGLKRTTVFRLLSALEGEGILRKTSAGDYALGAELIVWGGRAIRSNNLRTVAKPYMAELVRQTSESVTLDILWVDDQNRPMSMVIEEELGRHVMGMAQYIGGRFPAHTTSTGQVLLAWKDESKRDQLDLTGMLKLQKTTISSQKKFIDRLDQVRAQGFGETQDVLEVGLSAVAAPIFNTHSDVQGALCIAAPSSRMKADRRSAGAELTLSRGQRIDELAEMIVKSANAISKELGY
ncbi:MAG: IclR family transcriptional regulator [Anaerolineae bacterium]